MMSDEGPCLKDSDCRTLNCQDGLCQRGKYGQRCNSDTTDSCDPPLVCSSWERCVKQGMDRFFSSSSVCYDDAECDVDNYCDGSVCVGKEVKLGPCETDRQCSDGLSCHDSKCMTRCWDDNGCEYSESCQSSRPNINVCVCEYHSDPFKPEPPGSMWGVGEGEINPPPFDQTSHFNFALRDFNELFGGGRAAWNVGINGQTEQSAQEPEVNPTHGSFYKPDSRNGYASSENYISSDNFHFSTDKHISNRTQKGKLYLGGAIIFVLLLLTLIVKIILNKRSKNRAAAPSRPDPYPSLPHVAPYHASGFSSAASPTEAPPAYSQMPSDRQSAGSAHPAITKEKS